MTQRLHGKVALITGAARGQGRSHAVRLAEEGADVIAVDVCEQIASCPYPGATEGDLEETVRLVEKHGRRIVAVKADVRSSEQLDAAVASGVAELGRVDVVCANAGIGSFAPAWLTSDEQWRDILDINLTGVWRTCKAAIPTMIAQETGGSIIITSSAAALRANGNLAAYSSAKLGLVGLMRELALELAPHRVRVNTVHPCEVNTPMIDNDEVGALFMPGRTLSSPEERRDAMAKILTPIKMLPIPWVEAEDVSNLVAFLASDESRYITGTTMRVDGGYSAK